MSAASMHVTPNHVVTDDGEHIAVTVRGSTYVFKGETASIVRAHKAQYADDAKAAAFLHGFLLCLSLAHELAKVKAE